jgi:hypothetical protein
VSGHEQLQALEKELESGWSDLGRRGFRFAQVRARLKAEDLSKQDRSEFIRSASEAQTTFLSGLDRFLRVVHVFFVQQVVRELDRAMATMDAFYGRRRIRSIYRGYQRLKRLADRYHELEHLHGTARDHRRIQTYQQFYAGTVSFADRIRRLDPTMPRPAPRTLVERLYRIQRGTRRFVQHLPSLIRLVISGVRILGVVFSVRGEPRGTPFTNRIDDLFRSYGEIRGYDVHVEGREHLPASMTGKDVNIFAPAHRHGVTDNVTFSHLRLSDYLVFNAVDQLPLWPKRLRDRAARTNGLIPVGGGRGPAVDRALETLAAGTSRNILIYPEGSVSEGFRGTRPPRKNFGDGLIRRICEAGYGIKLVPVTYLDNARFLDLAPRSRSPEEYRLRVVVSPPLETRAIEALLGAAGGESINQIVRLAWLENLVTDEDRFLGQERFAAIERRLDRELDGIRYWGSVEPAPVSDLLVTKSDEPITIREEPFRGKRVRVFRIPESARTPNGRIPLENLAAKDSNELLIGIRAPAHIYLNAGSRRFDGDVFRRLSVRDRTYIYPGIIIRLVGVPKKSLNAIARKLETFGGREQRTITCANSACQVIARAANIRIHDHADMRPFLPSHVLPTRTIRKIVERGVRNHSGGQVQYQVYKTDDRSLEEILSEMRRAGVGIARDHFRMITIDAWKKTKARVRSLRCRC